MSVNAPRNNSLLPRLGSIGSPEYTIEFEERLRGPSQPHRTTIRAAESTVRWYNSLTTRKIQCLQLCKEGAQYFAVITLEDGSIFQLKYTRSKNTKNPRNVCSLFRLSENSRLLSTCLFSIEGAGDIAYSVSDVKFIIAICLPLSQKLDPSQNAHGTFFAVTIAAIIARKCVEINSDILASTGTPLDEFWRNIALSTKSADRPLWEEAIVDSIRDQVRNWVFLKAREHVAGCLFRHEQESNLPREPGAGTGAPVNDPRPLVSSAETQIQGSIEEIPTSLPVQMSISSTTIAERERSSAASVVAWLEFSGPKQAANSLAIWDATWCSIWEKEWGRAWMEFWTKQQGDNNSKVVKPSQFTDHIPLTSGRTSGKLAGKIPIDTDTMIEFMVKMPSNTLLQWECEHAATCRSKQDDNESRLPLNREVMWFKSWRWLRCPNPPDSWCPSWELAVIMAWILRWEKAVEAGQQLHTLNLTRAKTTGRKILAGPTTLSPVASQEQLSKNPITGKAKNPRNNLLAVTKLLGQMKVRYLKRVFEQPTIVYQADHVSGNYQGNPYCLLDKVVDFAWGIALKTPGSTESNLSNTATNAFHLARKNFGSQVPSRIAALPIGKWEQVFKAAWEQTWKKCWREAWTAVMKAAEKIVSERGYQEGISCARDDDDSKIAQRIVSPRTLGGSTLKIEPTVILSPGARAGLEGIAGKMLHMSPSTDCRRCIPAIFVSLEQMYRAMAHSGPVVHPQMVIKMFEEKPLLHALAYAKSKTKVLWDQKPDEGNFQIVSHAEFQAKVRSILNNISEAQDQKLEKPMVEWVAEVWQEVTSVVNSKDWDFIPEANEPEHRFRTLPPRAFTSHNVDTPEYGEVSQRLRMGQNKQSIIGRILDRGKTGS